MGKLTFHTPQRSSPAQAAGAQQPTATLERGSTGRAGAHVVHACLRGVPTSLSLAVGSTVLAGAGVLLLVGIAAGSMTL